jgi:SAM-dependent methyltransferase
MRDDLIEAMRRHLPPSGVSLRLLDVEGAAGGLLARRRGDLDITTVTGAAAEWQLAPASFDAVAGCDVVISADFLAACFDALRPGGRLIVALSVGQASADWVARLEQAGYTRILVEAVLDDGRGLLLRGEKPHTEARTLDRIRQVADGDAASDFDHYAGRYLHLLICQTPNKPAWALRPDDVIEWHAAAVEGEPAPALLAFSSLPKAVAFMQPAVMSGLIRDVNKVGKFSRETARSWPLPVLLNPAFESLTRRNIVFCPVDARSAEAPDE